MLFALFGIDSDALNLTVNLLVLSLGVVYLALVVWTYFDAKRRMEDAVLITCSVGASLLFPFIGTVIYSILRPPELLEDARERELEIRAAELRVKQLTEQSCPNCGYPIERAFLRCPSCQVRLKDPCPSCGKPVDPRWALCPYCEAPPVAREASARARREVRPTRGKRRAAAGPQRRAKAKPAEPGQAAAAARRAAAAGARAPKPGAARRAPADAPGEERPRPATAS